MRNRRLAAAVAADPRPQYVVAAAASISPSAFANVVAGRLRPTPVQQVRIAQALQVDISVIFGSGDLVVSADTGALIGT